MIAAGTLTALRLEARVAALEGHFEDVAATRMAGVPILHPGLNVEAVGFEPLPDAGAAGMVAAVGVLVTPWFMNLVWLPLDGEAAGCAAPGVTRTRQIGIELMPFIGARETRIGAYEACSLFSPMLEFADQAAAVATARAVLAELRAVPEAPVQSRRSLLFGRSAGAPQ